MSSTKRPTSNLPILGENNAHLAAELAEQYEELLGQFKQLQRLYEEQSALLHRLQAQAPLDDVTGLANRKTLEAELTRSLAQARRHGRTHGLILFQVEDYATFRALGETTEQAILGHVARLLRQNIRPTDIAARVHDGTFAVLLNEVRAADNAQQRARAMAEIAAQTPCMAAGRSLHVTLLTGVKSFGADDDLPTVFAAAEAALAQAQPAVYA